MTSGSETKLEAGFDLRLPVRGLDQCIVQAKPLVVNPFKHVWCSKYCAVYKTKKISKLVGQDLTEFDH